MKGFRFRLDPVLRVRRHELEQRRLELARAQRDWQAAEQLMQFAMRRAATAAGELEQRVSEGLGSAEFLDLQRGLESLQATARRAAVETENAARKVTEVRLETLEARTRVRALENLRERALDEYRKEMERRLQKELDEIGGRRHAAGRGVAWGSV